MKFELRINRMNMRQFKIIPGISVLLILCITTSGFSQQGLTLEQALNIAESNSPSMKRTRLSLIRSQENLNAQNASLKSQFSLSVNPIGYSQNRSFNDLISKWNSVKTTESFVFFPISQPILFTDARLSLVNRFGYRDSYSEYSNTTTKGFSNNLALYLDQPLFTFNRTKLQLKELELALENSKISYAIQLLSLERQVTQAFYYVYQQQQSLDIANQAFQNMQKSYEVSKNKVDAGISAREEMFQAELNMASSKSEYENSQVSFENAKNEFKGSLGLSVGLFGDNEKFGDVYANPTDNEEVSLSLTIPLWDWGERKSRIKASEASIESANISLEEEKNDIILGIRKVYRNLLNLQNQIGIAEQNVKNAQLTYDLNLEKYKNGDLTGMDLNIYQNQLSEKQLSYTNSLISYKLELLNLKIQTLYDFENKKPVSPVMSLE